jgi:hypothetical protein
VGEIGWLSVSVLGVLLAMSWGAGLRRARGGSERVLRLDDPPVEEADGLELSTAYDGSSCVITLAGLMDRPGSLALASHLAAIIEAGSDEVVVDVERAHPAARIVEALAIASPIVERHGARLALVTQKGEMLSASVQLTANGLGDRVSVYDSVAEAARAVR